MLAIRFSPAAGTTPAQKRRTAWLALWAFLKGAESLVGHLAERCKLRALEPTEPTEPPTEDAR